MMTSSSDMNIAAVIPALNEAATIGGVISSVLPFARPIVIDDGSSDETASIAHSFGAIVIRHEKNLGYEAALLSGFQMASQLGFASVITLDADGQHDPERIALFHAKLSEGFDVVVGVRDIKQRIGEHLFSLVGRICWNLRDPLCGMKAYKIQTLVDVGSIGSFDSVGTKFAIASVIRGDRVSEIEILTRPRLDAPRFGGSFISNIRLLKALMSVLFYYFPKNLNFPQWSTRN